MPINITMPALSPTMEEGNLAKWLVKEGDKVKSGDVIAEIETDKATMEVEAVDEGTVAKIVVPAGTEGVKVNAVIAVLAADGEDASAAAKAEAAPAKAEAPKAEAPKKEAAPAPARQRKRPRPQPMAARLLQLRPLCSRKRAAPAPSPRRSPAASRRMPASTLRPSTAPARMAAWSRPTSRLQLLAAAPRRRLRPSRRLAPHLRPLPPSSRCRTRRC